MTYATACEFIRRVDLYRLLADHNMATYADGLAVHEIRARADAEDAEQEFERGAWDAQPQTAGAR